MAPRTWRRQEHEFLLNLCETDEGRQLLSRASESSKDPWWLHCCNYWTRKYKDEFPGCFPAETEAEFQERKASQPHAKTLERFRAETEEERDIRLQKRIGAFLKGISPNRTRRTQATTSRRNKDHTVPATSSAVAPSASATAPPASASAPSTSAVSAIQPMHAADALDPSSPLASTLVQDREQFARVAKQLEHAVHDLAVCPSVSREDKLWILIHLFQSVSLSVAKGTGWVGWFPIGGMDEHRRFIFEHTSTAYTTDNLTFESYLSRKIGWSVDRLLCTFDDFIRDIYDPPQTSQTPSAGSVSPAGPSASSLVLSPEYAHSASISTGPSPRAPQAQPLPPPSAGSVSPAALSTASLVYPPDCAHSVFTPTRPSWRGPQAQPSPPPSAGSVSPAALSATSLVHPPDYAHSVCDIAVVPLTVASTPNGPSPRVPQAVVEEPCLTGTRLAASPLQLPAEVSRDAAAESAFPTAIVNSSSPVTPRVSSSAHPRVAVEKAGSQRTDAQAALTDSSAPPEGPIIVFGQPPPRVLTTPNPRKKAAPRERGGHRRGRRGGKISGSGKKSTKSAATTLVAGSLNNAATVTAATSKPKKKAALEPEPQASEHNENQPVSAEIVLGKRKRVQTAISLGLSPDFSAAKKTEYPQYLANSAELRKWSPSINTAPLPTESSVRQRPPHFPMGRTRTPQTSRSSRPRKTTSTPRTSRSKYHVIIRTLCDKDAARRLPYDHHTLHSRRCVNCHVIGEQFDRIVYLSGKAAWHIRICRRCSFRYYPPQTPPSDAFVEMIEAKRAELQPEHAAVSPLAHTNSFLRTMVPDLSDFTSPGPSTATPSAPGPSQGESSSSASSSSTSIRSGQTAADIAADEHTARELQRAINHVDADNGADIQGDYPVVDWPSDVFYNPVMSSQQTELDLARDAAIAQSLQRQDATPPSKKQAARRSVPALQESPTIFEANEPRNRYSVVTQQMMGMVPASKPRLGKRRKPKSKGKERSQKTPPPRVKKTPQPFPTFSPLGGSTPTPSSPSPMPGKKDAEVVVKIEPGTTPPNENTSAASKPARASSIISLSSDSEPEPEKIGRDPSVISISSDSEDDSPPKKKMRKYTAPSDARISPDSSRSFTTPTQSEDAATSPLELAISTRDLSRPHDAIVSPTASDFASNTSSKENHQSATGTPPPTEPRVVLHAPLPAVSPLPQTGSTETPRSTARLATLSLPWPDGKLPTSLAAVNEQALEVMRKIIGHIQEGTVVAQALPGERAAPIPHGQWVEAEYPLHPPRPLPDVAMKEVKEVYESKVVDSQVNEAEKESEDDEAEEGEDHSEEEESDNEAPEAIVDPINAKDEQRSPSIKSSARSTSTDGDWLIEVCEDTPFPGVWSFEVHPSVSDLRNGPLPKFHICARWLLKIVIWFRVDLPPVVKMITLDEATDDLRLKDYFITRRVFDTTGISEFRMWSRSSMDWKVCRPWDLITVSITENHTLLIRLPTVNNPVGFPEMLLQAMGPCTNVDHTRFAPHDRKGKARAD
ncbi:hypothetical protein OH76DRAFT_1484381 [Lentinus brumalis]|uniref:Uncharacterized protein n=1 Tax=Lentinus brumalis TaxID=2498619 RepID=A0A371D5X9_9APHY|nr:hypothetical protein OH76DRAFT_1484381 [Polyporus brumalis]